MKLRSLRLDNQPQLMIIPMIDIIFFLLVFFMMSTLSMVEQRAIPVNLPQASASQQDIKHNTAITVMQDGNVMFDQEMIPLPLLAKRVKTALIEQPENVFVLRADKQTEYDKVVAALDELKTAGARRISMATKQKAR